jgi:hypothetical protein
MENVFAILIFRTLTRGIGQYIRYAFFQLIGKKRSLKSLSNESKDEYKDLGHAFTQDFFNALIGSVVFFTILILVVGIVFS